MNLKPLNNNVIVKASNQEEMTKSGIFLPDTINKEKPEQGEVIAVGPGKIDNNGNRIEMSVKIGQKVVFKKYSPDDIKINNEEYLVINENDILAILE
jgi:chaperonin GroES